VRFELTEEQELIRRTARDFAERVLAPRARARDEEELFPEAELRQLAELGLLGVNVRLLAADLQEARLPTATWSTIPPTRACRTSASIPRFRNPAA
jgi:hypothetical protein